MANSGFIIHPSVVQVFTSGPNSGSIVSASFNETFNIGSGFTSASLCNTTYVYREQDFENCPVANECPVPVFQSVYVNSCENNSRSYGFFIFPSNIATTLFVEYSTSPTFTSNIGIYSRAANDIAIFSIDISDLPSLPVSKITPIYFRCYYDCGDGNIGNYSIIKSTSCPPSTLPATITSSNITKNQCYECATITVNIPIGSSRRVTISKTGSAEYARGRCPGPNSIDDDINEIISSTKIYTIGLDAFNGSTRDDLSRITVQVKNEAVIEASFILTRVHSFSSC